MGLKYGMAKEYDPDELVFMAMVGVIKKAQGATLKDYTASARHFIQNLSVSEDPKDQIVFKEILSQIDEKNWKEAGDGSLKILSEKLGVVLQLAANDLEAKLNAWSAYGEQDQKVKAIYNRRWQG